MSAIEERSDGSALDEALRTPPPVIFSAAVDAQVRPARASVDRKPLSQAASRRRTSWFRRLLAILVLMVAIAGIVFVLKDSKIVSLNHKGSAAASSTYLPPQALNPGRHGRHHRVARARHQ
ncbi:MAG: hypothetical protein ACYDHH_11155 [Solirubrobacteraceae bacterium]